METLALATIIMFLTTAFGPSAGTEIPIRPADDGCSLEARYAKADDLRSLATIASPNPSLAPVSLPDQPTTAPELGPVSSATLTKVEAVATAMRDCFAAQHPLRGLTGFSDEYLHRLIAADGVAGIAAGLAIISDENGPLSSGLAVTDRAETSGTLADGRVVIGRTVAATVPANSSISQIETEVWFVFVSSSIGWRLDDVLFIATTVDGTPWP